MMSANSHQMTEKAGLIVTFYGRRGKMQSLMSPLEAELGLAIQVSGAEELSKSDEGLFLRHFDLPVAYNTSVVQLALNRSGDASVAWEQLRAELERINLSQILHIFAEHDVLWGYSLIYHAVLVDKVNLDDQMRNTLFQPARRPNSSSRKRVKPLAHTKVVEDADLWLLDIPNEGHGAEAATVYVALSPQEREDELILKILYGPEAALLMPDLIAHKAYYQRREYIGGSNNLDKFTREIYKKRVSELEDIIGEFLGHTKTPKDLNKLKFVYRQVLSGISYLDQRHLFLTDQIENYKLWQNQLGQGDLENYHFNYMKITHRELELLINQGQRMLQTADMTMSMGQTELSQALEERDNERTIWIAILTLVVTASQLVNDTLAKEILGFLNGFSWISLSVENAFWQLFVKFAIFLLITAVIWVYWKYRQWRKRGE